MAGEWTTVALGSVTDLLTGFPFKSDQYVEHPDAVRLLRGDNVAQGVLRWDGAKRWPTDALDETSPYHLRTDDVILAMDRPWIEAGLKYAAVRQSDLPALLVQRVARLRGTGRLDTAFLKYVVGSRAFSDYVLAVQTGTAVPHISAAQIKSFEFELPPLAEQRAIAHILGTLDDKIEVNRRMSATLEAMARALFKAWFVDFEPVRAKSQGRDPGLPPHLAALFRDRLVETEEGEIPEGWEVRTVEDVMALAYGKALKASERVDGPVPVYGSGGVTGYHNESLVDGPSIIVGRKGTVGSLHWEDRPFFPIDTVFYVLPKAPLTFCFYHLQTLGLDAMNTDAAVPGLNRNNVYRLHVPWSPDALRECFDEIVLGYRRRMRVAGDEIETLGTLRDTLLPKLISGEIRVAAAERAVEAVA